MRGCRADFSFELWSGQGSWFWRLADLSKDRAIVGAAHSAAEAAREACAALEEIEPAERVIELAPALCESALNWNTALDRFGRTTRPRSGMY